MKRFINLIFSVISLIAVNAQNPSLSREVIAAGGDFFVSPVGSLSWTLGETVIETFESNAINIILTQGFQQPDELPVGIRQLSSGNVFVNLYPNPSVHFVRLDIKHDSNSKIRVELVDILGRTINSDNLDVTRGQLSNCGGRLNESLDCSAL